MHSPWLFEGPSDGVHQRFGGASVGEALAARKLLVVILHPYLRRVNGFEILEMPQSVPSSPQVIGITGDPEPDVAQKLRQFDVSQKLVRRFASEERLQW